ncbi:MAG: peptidylprolyl isomerase [Candidatus Woesearchaeota archaeon]
MVVKTGDKIKVDYEGTFDDGTVFDSSTHGDHSHPLEFEVGAKQVIPGFENAVLGMKKGEEKTFKLQPAEAYGDINAQLVRQIPRDKIPIDQEPKPGMMLIMQLPNGAQAPVKIAAVDDQSITLDLNHPLAGKVLNFKIKIVDITSPAGK